MRKVIGLLFAVFICLTDANAQALSDLRLNLFGGGSFISASRTFAVDGEIFNTKFESGPRAGIRGTASLTDRVSIEGTYSFGKNNLRVTNVRTIPVLRLFETRTHQLSGNVMYYMASLSEDWKPFVTVGLGITKLSPTQEAAAVASLRFLDDPAVIQSSNKFGVNFGGGTEYQVANSLGLRADFRNHLTGVPTFGLVQTPAGPGSAVYPVSGRANNMEFSGGVVIYLP
jgi:opacity protein-like surface antigen